MQKKIATLLLAVAATIPLTIGAVAAQYNSDEDIKIYAQELNSRIEGGRNTLSETNYQNLRGLWNKIDFVERQYLNRRMNDSERTTMMASLTNLDKLLTDSLHDDQNAHWQNWDNRTRSWRKTWWTPGSWKPGSWKPGASTTVGGGFNQEIDTYQRHLKLRIDQGRTSGRLTGSELARLTASYDAIDRMQRDSRRSGFNNWERNSLLSKLTQLDRDITTQMRDNENAHYQDWDSKHNKWNNNWYSNYTAPKFTGSQWKDTRKDVKNDWKDARKDAQNDWKDTRKDVKNDWKDAKKDVKNDWNDAKKDAKNDWKDAKKDAKDDWKHSKDNHHNDASDDRHQDKDHSDHHGKHHND